jgi:single-strand DNA-binding protein
MNINSVTLTGNLTREPETFGDGKVCKFGLAVNEREKKGDEWVDRASFFEVICFGRTGENVMKYLAKGSGVAIAGRIRQDRWQTDGGENRSKVVVVAGVVQFLDSRNGDSPQTETIGGIDPSTEPATSVAVADPSGRGLAGQVPDTPENVKALCICANGVKHDDCPIATHGVPFARLPIPDRETRRRDLFVGDVLPPGEGMA